VSAPAEPAELPAATRVGAVHLSVADLGRSLAFYEHALGLRVHDRAGARAALGAGGEDLLVLTEVPGARPADGFSGLFHFALLVPGRADLARWLAYVARERIELTGLSDHYVSEAVYLRDPDHHGIEVYWDRPRAMWEGQVAERMTTLPLDVRDLMAEAGDPAEASFDGLAAGTTMGHVHLRVADVPSTVDFYAGALGFDVMASFGAQATFLAAGGYHHHLGANVWESHGAPAAPAGHAALEQLTIVLPDAAVRDRLAERAAAAGREPVAVEAGVRLGDPSGLPVLLSA
jgi:catechol 2,3-dioxygenase